MRRALLIALFALAVTPTARAQSAACTLEASPSPAWPGANVTLQGDGFPVGADISVALGFFPVYDGFVGNHGAFEISFRVPTPFQAGPTELAVVDHTGGCQPAAIAIEISPAPDPEPRVAPWGLAVMAVAGVALGVGIAGVMLRRRADND